MKDTKDYSNQDVAVIGFGLEGKDLTRFLLSRGARVSIYDKKEKEKLSIEGFDGDKLEFFCGEDYLKGGLEGYDAVFRSPGVYRYTDEIVEAEKSGVEISSATKLFFDLNPANVIGVTGTKGKGTTASLITNILKTDKKRVRLAGNIGKPSLEMLDEISEKDWVVLELSSFQLIDLNESPHIAVVLNITEDHMDWHKGKDEYVSAKRNIVSHQRRSDFAVINFDYGSSKDFENYTKAKKYYFSTKKDVEGCFIEKGVIVIDLEGERKKIGRVDDLKLIGEHNWENACAASMAAYLAGASLKSISKALFSFEGNEHRLEIVGRVSGITFVNDSASTGPQPTIAAIKSFKNPTVLIAGGYDKKLDYDELGEEIVKAKNIERVVLIGQVADKIEKAIANYDFAGEVVNLGFTDMENIVRTATEGLEGDYTVVFSPAAASFDMFANYRERGKEFKREVEKYE